MTRHPRATLGRILEDLGATFTEQVIVVDDERSVGAVVIRDDLDPTPLLPDAIVLGVGVAGEEAILANLRHVGDARASALVVRSPVESTPAVEHAVRESGVALLTMHRGASWTQLVTLLGSLLGGRDFGHVESETLGGLPSGDLFVVANAIGSLLDAPITVEDRNSRVLAFSGRQDETDPSRIETILGRQVPERLAALLSERGVFSELYRSQGPVYVDPIVADGHTTRPRVAMAVRAGQEVLGSIWAAVDGPLTEDRRQVMIDASKVVALHLLQLRAGADVERRLRADLVSTALEGGPNGPDALERLALRSQPVCVLSVQVLLRTDLPGDREEALAVAERRMAHSRLADTLAVHLAAAHPRSTAAAVGDVIYGLLPTDRPERAEAVARDFVSRVAGRHTLVVGVSDPAVGADALPRARGQADRAARALLRRKPSTSVVAQIGGVAVDTILMDLGDLAESRDDVPRGFVDALQAYDEAHSSHLVDTLSAWLDAFGDVAAAAEAVHIHPNTFRYRLRRLSEITGMDLNDPNVRFAAMLELRLNEHGA